METQSRCFPYDKSIVINALYDTIDALGLCLDSSNSIRGTLIVSDARHTGRMRIALSAAASTAHTQVDVFPEDSDMSVFDSWNAVMLDELSGTIQRARHNERVHYTEEGEVL